MKEISFYLFLLGPTTLIFFLLVARQCLVVRKGKENCDCIFIVEKTRQLTRKSKADWRRRKGKFIRQVFFFSGTIDKLSNTKVSHVSTFHVSDEEKLQ